MWTPHFRSWRPWRLLRSSEVAKVADLVAVAKRLTTKDLAALSMEVNTLLWERDPDLLKSGSQVRQGSQPEREQVGPRPGVVVVDDRDAGYRAYLNREATLSGDPERRSRAQAQLEQLGDA